MTPRLPTLLLSAVLLTAAPVVTLTPAPPTAVAEASSWRDCPRIAYGSDSKRAVRESSYVRGDGLRACVYSVQKRRWWGWSHIGWAARYVR